MNRRPPFYLSTVLMLSMTTTVTAFVAPSPSFSSCTLKTPHRSKVLLHSRLFDEESNQEDEELIQASNPASEIGDALAKEFYRQLRERQQQENTTDETIDSFASSLPNSTDMDSRLTESQKRDDNAKPFSKRRVVSVASSGSVDNTSSNNRKYTGQSDSPLFGNVPPGTRERSSPREAMLEREFQLAGRGAGIGLGIQAGIAVFAVVFYIYVGLSGGIVSDNGGDFGGDDIIEYEQVIPMPRDTERSVWI